MKNVSLIRSATSWIPIPNPTQFPNANTEMKDPTQTIFSSASSTIQVATIQAALAAGTTYSFRMRFTNGTAGSSVYSNVATHTTPAPVLSANSAGTGNIALTFSGTTSPYFMIYKSTDGVVFSKVGYTGGTSYIGGSLVSGQTYYYYVKSWDQGRPSNTVIIQVP